MNQIQAKYIPQKSVKFLFEEIRRNSRKKK